MNHETLALTATWVALIGGILGILLPQIFLLFNRTVAAVIAGALALIATVAFIISNIYMPLEYNIRVDIFIIPPLLLLVYVNCIKLTKPARNGRSTS